MVDVTSFLLRWLYLGNMVRDVAEIQTLPYQPMQGTTPYNQGMIHAALHSRPSRPHVEEEWKDQCLRGILSYPPGTQRLYAIDSLRLELTRQLAQHLRSSDTVVKRYSEYCHKRQSTMEPPESEIVDDDDPYLDADLEIVRTFERNRSHGDLTDKESLTEGESSEATLIISEEGADVIEANRTPGTSVGQSIGESYPEVVNVVSQEELELTYQSLANFRDYLPQLVSAVLSSPGALQPDLLDPVQKLRRILLTRCIQDANWGIELCWLLEAEVGRAWKKLFEHRQQTGRRLIIVLPAEKAAVLAKIGTAKRAAFELLQDAEQATAYGYAIPSQSLSPYDQSPTSIVDPDLEPNPTRLPSSLSLRRCSHFGDTMHFVDRLTKISLDLRMVPVADRNQCLQDSLNEMNRRLRRRMVSKGDVSLDVEDSLGPDDWPHVTDVTIDMLRHSIQFPLEPKHLTWPGGVNYGEGHAADRSRGGVMRVLNIVSPECRLLSSRERCPFLVHMEVAETGMEGNDARLYASGASGLGATIGESLSMSSLGQRLGDDHANHKMFDPSFQTCKIPSELLVKPRQSRKANIKAKEARYLDGEFHEKQGDDANRKFPGRGGSQSDNFYTDEYAHPGHFDSTPYDMVRQQQYEQLHEDLMTQAPPMPQQSLTGYLPTRSSNLALLDRVFGLPWATKCEEIRQASPFGKVKGWRLASFIMKAGEDIRREALVMQVISKLNDWFKTDIPESHRPKMRPYTIMCVGGDAGLLECLSDAKSIDEIKKKTDGFTTLREYFERSYGLPQQLGPRFNPPPYHNSQVAGDGSPISFEQAQDNFLRSLVGYSLVCYILQIKDRHNANILMDREGHIMHIDFGFVLGDTPKMGKVPIFSERAPFKLSTEFWEVLGGWNYHHGGLGVKFCKMFELAFACASAHADEIASLVEAALMNLTGNPITARALTNSIRNRLRMRGPPGSIEQKSFIMDLVNTALTSWGTTTYDWLQKNMNGYQ